MLNRFAASSRYTNGRASSVFRHLGHRRATRRCYEKPIQDSAGHRHSPGGAVLPHRAEHSLLLRLTASRSQLVVMQVKIQRLAAPAVVVELWLSHCTG